jgi:hypothetical protein
MKIIDSLLLTCLIVLLSVNLVEAEEWRGIVPLKSTRADVEKMLGRSTDHIPTYDLRDEVVTVSYAQFPCDHKPPPGWPVPPPGWNVPKDTVVSIHVKPRKSVPLSSLGLDLNEFKRVRGDHDLPQHFRYVNEEKGYSIEVFAFGGEKGEIVSAYVYFPTAKEEVAFRCK